VKETLSSSLIIAFLKTYRRLSDKTQMFTYTSKLETHYRTRLTHTNEVVVISLEIYKRILEYCNGIIDGRKKASKINSLIVRDLTDNISREVIFATALAHDIGHTPFGHQGEETLEDILNDKSLIFTGHFKHNLNSFYILLTELFVNYNIENLDAFKICDGVFKHTNTIPKRISINEESGLDDFYNIDDEVRVGLAHIDINNLLSVKIQQYNKSFKANGRIFCNTVFDQYCFCRFPFFIEGQIVKIADEIAQRISDLDDSIRHLKRLNGEDWKILDKLINALKIASVAIINKDSVSVKQFCFNESNINYKKYINYYLKHETEINVTDNKAIEFNQNLIRKLELIKYYFEIKSEEPINNLCEELINLGISFYVKDVVGEFIRECTRMNKSTKITDKPYSYDGKNKTYKERIRFSNFGLQISDVLESFNFIYIIKGQNFEQKDIEVANINGGRIIKDCYNAIYNQYYSFLPENEIDQIIDMLNNRMQKIKREINIANNRSLQELSNAINNKDHKYIVDIMHRIYNENKSYKKNNYTVTTNKKFEFKMERFYAFQIARIIASMNNKYLIDLQEKIKL